MVWRSIPAAFNLFDDIVQWSGNRIIFKAAEIGIRNYEAVHILSLALLHRFHNFFSAIHSEELLELIEQRPMSKVVFKIRLLREEEPVFLKRRYQF